VCPELLLQRGLGLMTIEQLASRADTATSTVRMYQTRGLLPPPVRRGRIGYYGQGHLSRLRLIADLQEQGFSLASIKRLTQAWESGRSLEDVLGLETQVASVWAREEPVRLGLREFREHFPGQKVTPAVITRAIRLGLISVDGTSVVVRNPGFLRIGSELARRASRPRKPSMNFRRSRPRRTRSRSASPASSSGTCGTTSSRQACRPNA
jgi:DNA-binding transcriptional MerR regulator